MLPTGAPAAHVLRWAAAAVDAVVSVVGDCHPSCQRRPTDTAGRHDAADGPARSEASGQPDSSERTGPPRRMVADDDPHLLESKDVDRRNGRRAERSLG